MSDAPGADGIDADGSTSDGDGAVGDGDGATSGSDEPPGTAMRVGYAVAYFLVLGFSVGQAATAVADAVLLAPGLGLTTTAGTLVTAAVAGLLSGAREPPSVNRVILFSLVAVVLGFGLRRVVGPAIGDLRGSVYVALDAGLVWVGALLLAYAVAFGVDWSPVLERLPDAITPRRLE